jgi:uncharacterized protein YdaU (DUF1376 family)
MHYYKRHIGDYAKKAGHLSPLEHGVYNLIIDNYYDREHAPTMAEAMRWARARSTEEKAAVEAVLSEFFTLDGERYSQNRIEEELAQYHAKAETNRVIAVQREEQKRARREHESCTDRSPEQHDSNTSGQPNHKPLTTNHKPVDKVQTNAEPDGSTPVVSIEVKAVFEYWQTARGHEKAKLDEKRKRAIKARLKDGYSAEDLCRAVDGVAKSPHHMGQNDQRTVYDDIELICRTAVNVDKFLKLAGPQQFADPGLQRQIDILQEWAERP